MNTKQNGAETPTSSFNDTPLFPDFVAPSGEKIRKYRPVQDPIWTHNKARFIQVYLKYFVQVTKHGAYIDGFAGPQNLTHPDSWAAALVLESTPKWLRHFFLCEITKRGVRELGKLVKKQPEARDKRGRKISRKIEVVPGDFNANIEMILKSGGITQKEATFCLLDQRTFECHWATLKLLAGYKTPPNNKIELLYFLGVGWLHRSFSGVKKVEKLTKWWGNSGWVDLKKKSSYEIAEMVRTRFRVELGYRFSAAYPIYDRNRKGKVMYYMVHASDHPEAPALMVRAHAVAVRSQPCEVQLDLLPHAGTSPEAAQAIA